MIYYFNSLFPKYPSSFFFLYIEQKNKKSNHSSNNNDEDDSDNVNDEDNNNNNNINDNDEEEDDDSKLLSVSACNNTLNLVMRDPGKTIFIIIRFLYCKTVLKIGFCTEYGFRKRTTVLQYFPLRHMFFELSFSS